MFFWHFLCKYVTNYILLYDQKSYDKNIGRKIELLEKQNAILQAQLNEQRILNQQINEMPKTMNDSLSMNGMTKNEQPSQDVEELPAVLR